MPTFGTRSLGNLALLHPLLRKAADAAIKVVDFTVIEGQRNRHDQEEAFNSGESHAHFGRSPHNFKAAMAFDFIPYPFKGWANDADFRRVADAIVKAGADIGVALTAGYTFKTLVDTDHIELTDWRAIGGPLAE